MKFCLIQLSTGALVASVFTVAGFCQTVCRATPASHELVKPTTPEEAAVEDALRKAFDAEGPGRWLEAKQLYFAALESAEKLPVSSRQKRRAMMLASSAYERDQKWEQSIAMVKRVVDMDEKALGAQDQQVAIDLGALAMVYEPSNPAEAGRVFDQSVKLAEAATDMDCFERVGVFNNAAGFYLTQKRYADAEAVLRQAVDDAANLPSTRNFIPRQVRNMLAGVLRSEGKDGEADELMSTLVPSQTPAGNLSARLDDLTGPETDLARARQYLKEGKQQDADLFYRRAISALEAAPPRLAAGSLSGALDELGDICHSVGRDSEAENLFLRAVELREKYATVEMIWLVRSLGIQYALQNFYREKGRLSEMEPVYQRAMQIQRKYLDPNDEGLGDTFFSVASLYSEEGKYEQSLPFYQQALRIREHNAGPHDLRLGPILSSYAAALRNLGRADEAMQVEARAASLQRAKAAGKR
jgi:tetratricopeptide (TPR) repeat protein